jgi:hypothetical protein
MSPDAALICVTFAVPLSATQTFVPSDETPSGSDPVGNVVAVTLLEAMLISSTVFVPLVTQTLVPSDDTPWGLVMPVKFWTNVPVVVYSLTSFRLAFVTQTCVPSDETALG